MRYANGTFHYHPYNSGDPNLHMKVSPTTSLLKEKTQYTEIYTGLTYWQSDAYTTSFNFFPLFLLTNRASARIMYMFLSPDDSTSLWIWLSCVSWIWLRNFKPEESIGWNITINKRNSLVQANLRILMTHRKY